MRITDPPVEISIGYLTLDFVCSKTLKYQKVTFIYLLEKAKFPLTIIYINYNIIYNLYYYNLIIII